MTTGKSSHYESLADYTADVVAARNAYSSDQAVREGVCGTCQANQLDRGYGRVCWTCKHRMQVSA